MMRTTFIVLVFLLLPLISIGQQRYAFLDSIYIYKKIEEFSNKRKATQMLYRLVFRPVIPHPQVSQDCMPLCTYAPVRYSDFEGKVIRSIKVVTYDPFGYNTKDTTVSPEGFLPKAGNVLHLKTWPVKVKNLLIIKKYDTFDSLRVKESERLVRSESYVREVFMQPVLVRGDSVDIYVRVYDVWSVLITGVLTPSTMKVDLKDKNFLGAGHQFSGFYKQNYVSGRNSYSGNYSIPNIYNTYISSSLGYIADENRGYYQSLALNRSFYSVFTSWAGGISLQRALTREELIDFDSTRFEQRYKSNSQDYWLGHSWPLFKGGTEKERSTNFIASGRYARVHYTERATLAHDSMHLHANENFYLVGAGISERQYKQDNYIFRYGYVEDVPTGRAYSVVTGYQVRDSVSRWYAGTRLYMANYHKWGYFNLYCEYGTFFREKSTEEGSFSAGIIYFSNIIRFGKWKFRQFIKPTYVIGLDRKSYQQLSLNTENGIKGFNSNGLAGTEKLTFTFQLQSYAPWNIIGFRFGPYVVCSFGMLGTEKSGFTRSPLYSSFGIGLLIKNEYLILNTFQLSLVYYPFIPGARNDVFKVNPVKTTDFGFRGFDISQPSVVDYQ